MKNAFSYNVAWGLNSLAHWIFSQCYELWMVRSKLTLGNILFELIDYSLSTFGTKWWSMIMCHYISFIPFRSFWDMIFHLKALLAALGDRNVRIRRGWFTFLSPWCLGQNDVCKASLFYQTLLTLQKRPILKILLLSKYKCNHYLPSYRLGQ